MPVSYMRIHEHMKHANVRVFGLVFVPGCGRCLFVFGAYTGVVVPLELHSSSNSIQWEAARLSEYSSTTAY